MKFLLKVGLGPLSKSDFFLEVIRIGLHCNLEVTVDKQGHIGIESTVAQRR